MVKTKGSTTIELNAKLTARIRKFLSKNDNKIRYRSTKGFAEHAILEKLEREHINKSK